jgi:hypothetical protein
MLVLFHSIDVLNSDEHKLHHQQERIALLEWWRCGEVWGSSQSQFRTHHEGAERSPSGISAGIPTGASRPQS